MTILPATVTTVPLDQLDCSLRPHLRAADCQDTIDRYAEIYDQGDTLPPLTAYRVDDALLLVDGWHRLAAHQQLGRATAEVAIYAHGTRTTALLAAIAANQAHGLPLRYADRANMAMALLANDDLRKSSDRELARITGLSPTTVGRLRADMGAAADRRIGADGREQAAKKRVSIADTADESADDDGTANDGDEPLTPADCTAAARGLAQRIRMRYIAAALHHTKATILAALHLAETMAGCPALARTALGEWVNDQLDVHPGQLCTAGLVQRQHGNDGTLEFYSLTPTGRAVVRSVIQHDEQHPEDPREFPDIGALQDYAITILRSIPRPLRDAELEEMLESALSDDGFAMPSEWQAMCREHPIQVENCHHWSRWSLTDATAPAKTTADDTDDEADTDTDDEDDDDGDDNAKTPAAHALTAQRQRRYLIDQAAPAIARATRLSTYSAHLIAVLLGGYEADAIEDAAIGLNLSDPAAVAGAIQSAALATVQQIAASPCATQSDLGALVNILGRIHGEIPGLDWQALTRDAEQRFA